MEIVIKTPQGIDLASTLRREVCTMGGCAEGVECFCDELAKTSKELEFYKERGLENSIRSYGWMEAHDKLQAGLPYKFPSPADKDVLRARIERLENALRNIANLQLREANGMKDAIGDKFDCAWAVKFARNALKTP